MLLTVKLDPRNATIDGACAHLGIDRGEIDEEFGVVSVDPATDSYAVLVEESASTAGTDANARGPYANPRIEPLGQ
jgi:hypothetical protein